MSSKPSSQPASHRSGRSIGGGTLDADAAAAAQQSDDPTRDGSRSEASAGDLGAPEELLTRSLLKRGLLDLAATADRSGFAFSRLDLQGQGIKTLEGDLSCYPELRYVNLGNNEISDLSGLSVLPRVMSLQVAHNHLADLDTLQSQAHPHCQLIQADHCEIQHILSRSGGGADPVGAVAAKSKKAGASTGPRKPLSALSLNFPSLFALTLSNNKIASIVRLEDAGAEEFQRDAHPSLQVLDLPFNQLLNLDAIGCFPELRILNLQSNLLENLEGVQGLKQLEKLNVSDNKLVSLLAELPRLAALPKLTHLVLAGNPLLLEELERNLAAAIEAGTALESQQSSGVDMVSEILIELPRLLFLDGKRITAAMRKTADLLKKERAADLERRTEEENLAKKLAAEEEEAEKKARQAEEDEEKKAEEEEKDSEDEEKDPEAEEEDKDKETKNEDRGEEEEDEAEKSMDSNAAADAEADADADAADDAAAAADDDGAGADQSFDDAAGGGGGDEPAGDEDDDGGAGQEEEDGEGEEEEDDGEEEEEEEEEEDA